MIVSVHLPKTAGKSFQAALTARFGESLLEDYGDFPMNTPEYDRNRAALAASLRNAERDFRGIECIHGHFLPVKYLLLSVRRPVTFVTWMRDPIQRLVSNYHYWRRSYDARTAPPLHRRMVEEAWSLEQFHERDVDLYQRCAAAIRKERVAVEAVPSGAQAVGRNRVHLPERRILTRLDPQRPLAIFRIEQR